MPSVASFMMPACKCVTACPEDKLRSVVDSLVNEKIGCVVVVDTLSRKAVGIITKQDVNRYFLSEVSARNARSLPRPFPSSFDVSSRPAPRKATTKNAPRYDPTTAPSPNRSPSEETPLPLSTKVLGRIFSVCLLPRHPAADPSGHASQRGHEHQPAPGEARHAQGRRRGAAPAREDSPRDRRWRGREVCR